MNILKVIGIVDGVALAAITALGHYVPAWAPVCQAAVIVLGSIGTAVAGYQAQKP